MIHSQKEHKQPADELRQNKSSKLTRESKSGNHSPVEGLITGLFCLLFIVTPLLVVPAFYMGAISPKYAFSKLVMILIASIGAYKIVRRGTVPRSLMVYMGWLLLLMVLGIVPSLFRENRALAWYNGNVSILWIGMAALTPLLLDKTKQLRWVVLAIICGGVLAALYGLMQYLNLDFLHLKWIGRQMVGKQIMISTFGNANFFAAYLVPIFLIMLGWLVIAPEKPTWRIFGIIGMVLLSGCILLSGVRSAWVSLPISLIACGIFLIPAKSALTNLAASESHGTPPIKKKKIIIWLLVAMIAIGSFVSVVRKYQVYNTDWLRTQIRSLSNVHELEERFLIWQIAMQMIRQHPVVGTGTGSFAAEFFPEMQTFIAAENKNSEYNAVLTFISGRNANHVHNDYLQMTGESGLLYTALFSFLLIAFFYFQVRLIRSSEYQDWRIRQIFLVGALIPYLIDMSVSFPLNLPANGLLFWGIIGLSIAHVNLEKNYREKIMSEWVTIPPVIKTPLIIVLVLVLSGLTYSTVQSARSDWHLRQGIGKLQQRLPDEALEHLTKAVAANPTNANAYLYLGKLYGFSGMYDQALEQYQQAARYGTDDLSPYEDPAIFYFVRKDYLKAAQEYEFIIQLVPNHSIANKQLAVIYSEYLPNKAKAIQHLEKYLATNPPENEKLWFQERISQLQNSP